MSSGTAGRLLFAFFALPLLGGCKPSAQEIARRADEADAAERARAHAANAQRKVEFDIAASAGAKKWAAPSQERESGSCISITAERAIARMGACGIDVSGFTPENVCKDIGQTKLLFIAAQSCPELLEMISDKD